MAGHSKWKNIKHRKSAVDKAKMKKFTKLSKEIFIAAKNGQNPLQNQALRSLIEKANFINMPKENYMRAIKKAADSSTDLYESFFYEGYGPCGIAVIIEFLSDNKNKAAALVRQIFTKNGGNLSDPGTVSWLFNKCGIIQARSESLTEDEIFETIMEFSFYDFSFKNGEFFIFIEIEDLAKCKKKLLEREIMVEEEFIGYSPKIKQTLSENEYTITAEFIDKLENIDDVQNVYVNI